MIFLVVDPSTGGLAHLQGPTHPRLIGRRVPKQLLVPKQPDKLKPKQTEPVVDDQPEWVDGHLREVECGETIWLRGTARGPAPKIEGHRYVQLDGAWVPTPLDVLVMVRRRK